MGLARQRDAWDRSSALMALIANCNRDSKKTDPFKPADFNPLASKSKQAEEVLQLDPKMSINILASLFVGAGNGQR